MIYILYIYIIDSCPPIAKHIPKTENLGSKTSWIFDVFLILFCCFARPFGNKKHLTCETNPPISLGQAEIKRPFFGIAMLDQSSGGYITV